MIDITNITLPEIPEIDLSQLDQIGDIDHEALHAKAEELHTQAESWRAWAEELKSKVGQGGE